MSEARICDECRSVIAGTPTVTVGDIEHDYVLSTGSIVRINRVSLDFCSVECFLERMAKIAGRIPDKMDAPAPTERMASDAPW
jgi:hypothetical protein